MNEGDETADTSNNLGLIIFLVDSHDYEIF